MNAARQLYKEHHLMFRVLWALERFIHGVEHGAPLEAATLQRFSEFFVNFADNHHAEKEETVLLPALASHGEAWPEGPLADARREHRTERYLMRVLSQEAMRSESSLDGAERSHLLANLREFIASMSAHMRTEEDQLFPLTAKLSAVESEALDAAAARFDDQSEKLGEFSAQRENAEALCAEFPPLSSRPGSRVSPD